MSYGGAASTTVILGSMAATLFASKVVHNMIIGSGSQPATMCAEYKAAEVKRALAKPCQSCEKTMVQNPIFNSAFDWETGRAPIYMLNPGDKVQVAKPAEE